MKLLLVFGAFVFALGGFADDVRQGAPVSYSCSKDQTLLIGSDGSTRDCDRFRCISDMCETFCNNTGECTTGTCDVPSGRCI